MLKKSCLMTSYFTKNKDPQYVQGMKSETTGKDGRVINNNYDYIKGLYESVKDKNLDVIFFHDGLSDEFIKLYSRNNIRFIKVPVSDYSNNDYRFMCYLHFLKEQEYDKVFMCDGSDVTVVLDPSRMEIKNEIMFCEEPLSLNNYQYGATRYLDFHKGLNWSNLNHFIHSNYQLLNMGVIGSNYQNAIKFLGLFCSERIKCNHRHLNINMPLGNYIARNFFENIAHGSPFCSEFKKFQTDRKDVYFIHK